MVERDFLKRFISLNGVRDNARVEMRLAAKILRASSILKRLISLNGVRDNARVEPAVSESGYILQPRSKITNQKFATKD